MNPRFYCNRCGHEVYPGETHCGECGTKIPGFIWDKPGTGPTLAERGVEASEPVPEFKQIPPVGKSPFAEYPRGIEPHCPKCGAELKVGSPHCWSCGYKPRSAWERAGAFMLLLLSTSCVCCGPCVIGGGDTSGVAIILLLVAFLAAYIWGWVWYVRRYR